MKQQQQHSLKDLVRKCRRKVIQGRSLVLTCGQRYREPRILQVNIKVQRPCNRSGLKLSLLLEPKAGFTGGPSSLTLDRMQKVALKDEQFAEEALLLSSAVPISLLPDL